MTQSTLLGTTIATLRKLHFPNLQAREFAEQFGISPNYLSKLESGAIQAPSPDRLELLAEAFTHMEPFLRRVFQMVVSGETLMSTPSSCVNEIFETMWHWTPSHVFFTGGAFIPDGLLSRLSGAPICVDHYWHNADDVVRKLKKHSIVPSIRVSEYDFEHLPYTHCYFYHADSFAIVGNGPNNSLLVDWRQINQLRLYASTGKTPKGEPLPGIKISKEAVYNVSKKPM